MQPNDMRLQYADEKSIITCGWSADLQAWMHSFKSIELRLRAPAQSQNIMQVISGEFCFNFMHPNPWFKSVCVGLTRNPKALCFLIYS